MGHKTTSGPNENIIHIIFKLTHEVTLNFYKPKRRKCLFLTFILLFHNRDPKRPIIFQTGNKKLQETVC